MTSTSRPPTALVTGASAGLGRALATALARRGWTLVLDARGADRLSEVATELGRLTTVETVAGSVTDPEHRVGLAAAVRRHGPLDLLVHNASELGASPQPRLDELDPHTLRSVLETNLVAPAALTRELLPDLVAARGTVLAISSDAAVEHYEGWGAYGASKAALDHLVGTFAAEQPAVRWYAVDPGDMRTAMHQAAFPGEDISDRPWPETVVPSLLRLLDVAPPSGRYRASDYAVVEALASALLATPTTRFPTPDKVTAVGPPESRGIPRDGVRLLVARAERLDDVHFRDIGRFLRRGDVLVVNTSATVAREVDAWSPRHGDLVIHLSTSLDDGTWVVELRSAPAAATPVLDGRPGEDVHLGEGVLATLLDAYPAVGSPTGSGNRLWRASVSGDLTGLLRRAGRPIAYGYLDRRYPLRDYQTVFSRDPGSAEMPSAGRPFTNRLVTRLVRAGVLVAPVLLHTGVSSQDAGEAPQPERFEVTDDTAALVNAARSRGGRVVAVGTTATRAIESATRDDGLVEAASGWTELVIGPDRPVRVVRGLVTGWHNPEASHLLLVEAVAGADLTQRAYDAAVADGYAWHEFGDSCLMLPG